MNTHAAARRSLMIALAALAAAALACASPLSPATPTPEPTATDVPSPTPPPTERPTQVPSLSSIVTSAYPEGWDTAFEEDSPRLYRFDGDTGDVEDAYEVQIDVEGGAGVNLIIGVYESAQTAQSLAEAEVDGYPSFCETGADVLEDSGVTVNWCANADEIRLMMPQCRAVVFTVVFKRLGTDPRLSDVIDPLYELLDALAVSLEYTCT